MFVNRTMGVAAAALGALALGACDDPAQDTDLRPEGPPDVLAVLVMTDASSHLVEKATYCRPNDAKRPSAVGLPDITIEDVCPATLSDGADEVENAYPDGWYVRIMFDELLDASIEELIPIVDSDGEETGTFEGSIKAAHPVDLKCESINGGMVNVDYDGYYQPAGNRVTWPLGPSLVIKPTNPLLIATNTACEVTLTDAIVDKNGEKVPSDQRGPFTFKIAPITILATDPGDSGDADDPTVIDPSAAGFLFSFNTDVRMSLCADTDSAGTYPTGAGLEGGAGLCDEGTEQFEITPPVLAADGGGFWGVCSKATLADLQSGAAYCSSAADCGGALGTRCDNTSAFTLTGTAAATDIAAGYGAPVKSETEYSFKLKDGIKLKDRCGRETTFAEASPDDGTEIRFKTDKFGFAGLAPAEGETAPMSKKVSLTFNSAVDYTTLDVSEFTISPTPASAAVGQTSAGDDVVIGGNFAPDTTYTFTLKAGATVEDWYGKVYTNATEKKITWKTEPKVRMTSTTADETVITKLATQQSVGVALTFNANMDATTLTEGADFTFVNKAGVSATTILGYSVGVGASTANCSAVSKTCQLRVRADLTPGDWTFTLKKDAAISDKLGNVYTQEADKVIHITVKAPVVTPACL